MNQHDSPTASPATADDPKTHFGFREVRESEKARHVRQVFDSVASKYDVMNDLMSGGMHRLWKIFTVGQADIRPGHRVLDLASGTGDLAKAFAQRVGKHGCVVMTDINQAMLSHGRDRMLNAGLTLPTVVCDAEKLPFPDESFDRVSVAFGLRNMTHKDQALSEMRRVLKPGGKLLVLEFSKVVAPLEPFYDWYSFKVLPWLGQRIANDAESYRYLAESIRMHPAADELAEIMRGVGLERVRYNLLTGGVVALHQATRF